MLKSELGIDVKLVRDICEPCVFGNHRTEFRRDWTAPYKPEQNGGSKLENRTIVEMARTFKYSNSEVELPDAIWAELVTSAIYILNRTGKSPKVGVSPHSL
jgi:hypothetical protein